MSDEKTKIVPPAKVHGDSGVTAVVADIDDPEAGDIEATEDDGLGPADEDEDEPGLPVERD